MARLSPSSKWIASTIITVLTAAAVIIADAQSNGVELPSWLVLVGGVLGPVATWLKAENRPSVSALHAMRRMAGDEEPSS